MALEPKMGDYILVQGGMLFELVPAVSGDRCEGCNRRAVFVAALVGKSNVPVAAIAYCEPCINNVFDGTSEDVLLRRVS